MRQVLNKLKQNKKLLIPITSILLLIVLLVGVSFAVFNYSNENASGNNINSGFISMTYTEPSNEYIVENALPIKDSEGMNSSNYFEFSVTTTAPTNGTDDNGVSIPYEISITETEGNTLTNDKIKMYVTEVEGEKENVHTIPTLVSYFEPSLYKDNQIKVGFNLHLHRNGNETITTKYRLRAWIDNNVDVSDWDIAGKYQYKFKVNVNGEATYQGYETDQSCFAYEKNDNNNYSITGYDFNKCGGKNIVIPETLIVDSDIILENINWASDEGAIEAYKNYLYAQGECSSDLSWSDCLTSLNTTEADLLAEYLDIKNSLNPAIGYEKSVIEDADLLDALNMFVDIGFCTLEWSEAEKITVKVDTIKSFSSTIVAAASNKNDVYSVNNLNNVTGKYKTSLSTMADTTPIINGLIIPEDIIIENDAFKNVKVEKIVDRTGNFPLSCFGFYVSSPTSTFASVNSYKCQGISDVILPSKYGDKTVTTVGGLSNKGLTNVVISNTITYIASGAFANNNLTKLVIPNTVKYIVSRAFIYNDLNTVILPDGIDVAGDSFSYNPIEVIKNEDGKFPLSCFSYTEQDNSIIIDGFRCIGVSYADIPSEINGKPVVTIGKNAFYNIGLTNVNIPDSVITIGYYAFRDNELTKLIIPDSVTTIDTGAFSNNELKKVKFGNGVTTIGIGAFSNNQLTTIDIPNSVITMGRSVFEENKLISATFGNGLTTIGDSAFSNNKLKEVKFGNNVTTIGSNAFSNNELSSLIIGNSVQTIGDRAFQSNQLTSVDIPDSVTTIGNSAFYDNQLTSVTFGNSVTTIKGYAFSNNELSKVTIPDSATTIGDAAFYSNKLRYVKMQDNVILGENVFDNNKISKMENDNGYTPAPCYEYSVTDSDVLISNFLCPVDNVKISPTINNLPVTTIGDEAFKEKQLKKLEIPNNVITIGTSAFSNNQLTSVDLPDSVIEIKSHAFQSNEVSSLIIGNSVQTIGRSAFQSNQLTSVDIPDSVTTIDNYAFAKNQLKKVEFGNSVTNIGYYAFGDNELTELIIPDSVTSIRYEAFAGNKLINVTIGKNVNTIVDGAFLKTADSNPNLTKIINKTGLAFDWNAIINNASSTSFINGTVTNSLGNVEIVKG